MGGFIDENPEQAFAVVCLDFVGGVLGEEFEGGIDDVHEHFGAAVIAYTDEVGADRVSFLGEPVAGGAAFGEDGVAGLGVALEFEGGLVFCECIGACGGRGGMEQGFCEVFDFGILVIQEEGGLVGVEVSWADEAVGHGLEESHGRVGSGEEDAESFTAEARG